MNIAGMLALRRHPRAAGESRFFYGWAIVAAAFWVDLLGYGVVTVAFGVFFPVMSASLGWGRGLLAGALPFILVYGLTRGAQSLLVSLAWADYFGRGIQGRVRGFAAPFRVVTAAGGPVLAGVFFDVTGTYTVPFLIFAAMFALGGGLSYAARPPRLA